MNKSKMMTVAVLACALMLGACVDDKESASVENIRTAKAAQMTALATYNNALAEATLINAKADALVKEADVAVKNAEALVKAAEAKLAEAEALGKEAETALLAADLEAKKQETAQLKQKFEVEIEKLKAESALAIAQAEKSAEETRQAMQKNAEQHVLTLFTNYQTANTTLAGLNDELFGKQVSLISAEAALVDWKVQKADEILACNKEIAKQTAIKNALQKLPENNQAAAIAAAEANKKAKIEIDDRKAVAVSKYTEAKNAYTNAVDAIAETETAKQGKFLKDEHPTFVKIVAVTPKDANGETASKAYDTYTIVDKLVSAQLLEYKIQLSAFDEQLGKATDDDTQSTLYGALAAARKAEAEAKKEADKSDASNGDKQAYADAMKVTAAAQKAIEENRSAKAEASVNYDKLVAAQAAFGEDGMKAYNAAIVTAEAAAVIEIAANVVIESIDDELAANVALQAVLQALADGLTDIKEQISACDVAISAKQKAIAIAEAISDKEQLVAYTKEQIANLKAEIADKTRIVTYFKQELDAALAV